MRTFTDRVDAGRRLARELATRDLKGRLVVLGLPRGGVPVAAEVAHALHAPLDVLVVRKVGAPGQEELALGAVGEEGAVVRNDAVIRASGISPDDLGALESAQQEEVERRASLFRHRHSPTTLKHRTAIIVDDGIATGATMRAACAIARARGAARIVVAVPVAAPDTLEKLPDADEVICLHAPEEFMAVGMHYVDFRQTSDAEVVEIMSR